MRRLLAAWLATLLGGCGGATGGAQSPISTGATAPTAASPDAAQPPSSPGPAPPRRGLSLVEARRLMVQLINRDRASMGLAPVELEEGAATRAGQAHAEDMAAHGYLAHWGTDGSVPEQRFTEAGGVDMVMENVSCFGDGRSRALDGSARIDPGDVEHAEDMFFHERPPNDGHRQNILKPWHAKVGIGIAQPVRTPTEIPVPCIAQEFVDSFGSYAPAPGTLRTGDVVHVEGSVKAPATFAGVGLARIDAPKPLSASALNGRGSYPVPVPYEMVWPAGYKTPIPVRVTGNRFAVDLPVSDQGRPGIYELSVWAKVPGSPDFVMVSLRTIRVLPR
jgi:uncharacterized protein YkwD